MLIETAANQWRTIDGSLMACQGKPPASRDFTSGAEAFQRNFSATRFPSSAATAPNKATKASHAAVVRARRDEFRIDILRVLCQTEKRKTHGQQQRNILPQHRQSKRRQNRAVTGVPTGLADCPAPSTAQARFWLLSPRQMDLKPLGHGYRPACRQPAQDAFTAR